MGESYFVKSDLVTELTPKDFESKAPWKLKEKKCSVIMFYANWCPHCKDMKNTWERLAQKAAFKQVCAFDCAKQQSHFDKMSNDRKGLVIEGFPTIVFYKNGEPVETYSGSRDLSNLLKACMRVCSPQ